jgi:NAD(P)-dependent dehydrogenase (short-subunit alcohol dehydrogenase family)
MTKQPWKGLGYAAAALTTLLVGRSLLRHSRRIQLAGKKVLVVGGSRGLGFAAARRFLREGADVAICARYEAELARAAGALRVVAASMRDSAGHVPKVICLRADVTEPQAAAAMIEAAIAALGRIDVLVNCAVEITIGPLEALTAEDFEQAFRGIFFAVYRPTMAVLPHMKTRTFGRIVNVTSVAGKAPVPHSGTYAAGKFAATGFSAICAAELRKYGIYVSTIFPPPLRNGAWLNGSYKGLAEEELSWFARALQSPLTSADPERAAYAIVEAARFGDVERMVTPTSFLQARLHALWPSLSIALAAYLDARWLPATPPGASALPAFSGEELLTASSNPAFGRVTRAARRDAERYLQPIADKLR